MKKSQPFQEIELPLFRKLVIDASALAKKKSTIYGLVEFDITDTFRKLRKYRIKTKSPLSLTAYVISCIGKAVETNPQVHGFLNRKNKLVCFEDVDLCLPIEIKIDRHYFPAIHILRSVNKRSCLDIEQEIRKAKEQGADNNEYRRKWKYIRWFLSLPAFIRKVFYYYIIRSPRRFKKHMGTVAVTAVGMFGAGSGWGLGLLNHTLEVVIGGKSHKPVYLKGQLEKREFLSVTIAVDHDVVDGAPGARFARDLRELVEKGYGLDGD